MNPKLYLESTIISVLTARSSGDPTMATMQEWTKRWWNERRHDFQLFASKFVLDEIALGDPEIAQQRLSIASKLPILQSTKTMRRFARKLFRALALPNSARLDAFHLAIAIEGGMDYLLTWNCAHIDNPYHQPTIQKLALQRGYSAPVICSPRDFLEGDTNAAESD
jgi:hypothetical protein